MDEKFVEVKFLDWTTHPPEGDPALLLCAEETNRIIPIWIDLAAAAEYSARETGATQRHPGIREVFVNSLDMMGQGALRDQITDVHESVFVASLVLEGGAEIDIHPSDLILVARELEVLPYVTRDVLDTTSITMHLAATNGGPLADESETDSIETSMSELAKFLDSIDIDYFVEPRGDVEDKRSDGEAGGSTDSTSSSDR